MNVLHIDSSRDWWFKNYSDQFDLTMVATCTKAIRNKRLAMLMTEMEVSFAIPLHPHRFEQYRQHYPEIAALYLKVSESRSW